MEKLAKTYSPGDVEKKWYETWENEKYFKPRPGKVNETFCVIMPPPNVTGRLHAGHALDVTTQDTLVRFKRMKGYEALFLPGMDHAGIATQSVVENMTYEQEGKTRHDFSREDFLKKIWKWKEEYGGIIAQQQRSMGASPDWDYSMFTMDPEANEAVNKAFVDLYNEGLIYQSDYIINWDTVLQSAISDAEVEHIEVQGAFYHIKYPIKGTDDYLEVATTRPETLLGDTAVCVHPEDDRFQKYIGKTAMVPLCNREVPIVADEHVDMEKGTGCLKVTPGHDFNDFEIGERHNLPIINILNKDGTLNENAGEFQGLDVKRGRKAVVEKLKEKDLLLDIKPHVHQVGHGDRSKSIIEPMVSKQWFLNVQGMAKVAVDAVEKDKTRFYPKSWENTYFAWLREPKNWCISRQLWWGHRIPVYYCKECDHQWATASKPNECPKCQSKNIYQDPDVLDTWFSSGLWPLTTLGWPDEKRMKERGFDKFYPTSVLVTGFDIIFFWVARMMMMGLKFDKEVPFHKIYIHAIVRDKFGRKMSKSLGNGIDPLETVKEYGADAFRFTLAAGSGYNRTLNLDPERINGYRNFINKIWNAFRFIHPFLDQAEPQVSDFESLDHHERWILAELNTTTKIMNESLEEFRYDDACSALYSFIYDKFCSWFIELSKPILYGSDEKLKVGRGSVLRHCFRNIVALLHPISPFITEELWKYLKKADENLLIIQDYPEHDDRLVFPEDQEKMNKFIEVITKIRDLRASVNIKPKEKIKAEIYTDNEFIHYLKGNLGYFDELAGADKVDLKEKSDERLREKRVMRATTHSEIFLPLEGVVDFDEQVQKLEKELTKAQKDLEKFSKKLQNKKFINNAPVEVVEETKEKAYKYEQKVEALKKNIEVFKL